MLTKTTQLRLGFEEIMAKQVTELETLGIVKGVYILYREILDVEHKDSTIVKGLGAQVVLKTQEGTNLTIDLEKASLTLTDRQINSLMEFIKN
jgi:hypothetical protein